MANHGIPIRVHAGMHRLGAVRRGRHDRRVGIDRHSCASESLSFPIYILLIFESHPPTHSPNHSITQSLKSERPIDHATCTICIDGDTVAIIRQDKR
jgi:hypothetical protein